MKTLTNIPPFSELIEKRIKLHNIKSEKMPDKKIQMVKV